MEVNKKLVIGVFAMLALGVVLVSAGSFYSVNDAYEQMIQSDDFAEMHAQMMAGNFEAVKEYHEQLDFECPMHDSVVSGEITMQDFATMQEWMMSGDFPAEKPETMSDAAWELHVNHHPEIYG